MQLDWQHIGTWQEFQKLTNDLFALECGSPHFIPSSPLIGADGGWDGRYPGEFLDRGGLWSIQAKHTSKSGQEALSWLKGEVKEELEKAEGNEVDYLLIATNAELRADYVAALQQLNTGQVTELIVWHREALRQKIEGQPWIVSRYFGVPQHPAFVPEHEYTEACEASLADDSNIPLVARDDIVTAIAEDCRQVGTVTVLHGQGGSGKSRILREVARSMSVGSDLLPWFFSTGYRDMRDALRDELPAHRKYLLILDNAESHPEEAECLCAFTRARNAEVHVLLSCRTPVVEMLRSRILRHRGVTINSTPLELPQGTSSSVLHRPLGG